MGVFKKQGVWWIDYYFQGRRKRERIGSDRGLAKNVLHKRKIEIAEKKFLEVKKKDERIRFDEFADYYLEIHSKVNNKSWRKSDLSNITILKRFFGKKYLFEITPEAIEKFKTVRLKEVSPTTVNRNVGCLKCMFNKAIEWGKIKDTPARRVRLLRVNNKRLRYLEKEEIRRLLVNCSGYIKPIVILALNTGMRRGEILGLKWQDIDFKRDIIYLLNTKNGEKREIPLNEMAKVAVMKVPKNPDSPYVFCNKTGNPFTDIRKSFFTALKKSGIINFRFHDLRHTFASQLVMSGVDLNTVRELMGHKSIEMTLRYSHLSPDHKRRAVEVLNRQIDSIWTPIWTPKPHDTIPADNSGFITPLNTDNYDSRADSSAGRTPGSQSEKDDSPNPNGDNEKQTP